MISIITALIIVGVIGYLIVNFVPMIEPIKTIVIIGFVIIAIYYLLKMLPLIGVPSI